MKDKQKLLFPLIKVVECKKIKENYIKIDNSKSGEYLLISKFFKLAQKVLIDKSRMRVSMRKHLHCYYGNCSSRIGLIEAMMILSTISLILTISALKPIECFTNQQSTDINNDNKQNLIDNNQKATVQVAQRRLGGLEPGDYIDEAGELDIMANQQQIPTAHLMAAAGHIVPENFFLPGGSIPAQLYNSRYQQQQQQQQHQQHNHHQHQSNNHHHNHHQQQQQQHHQQQQQQPIEAMQQLASQIHARYLAPNAKYHHQLRQADLIAAAASQVEQQQQEAPIIDFNSYNLINGQTANELAGRESASNIAQGPAISQSDLIELLASASAPPAVTATPLAGVAQPAALYEQQQQQQHQLSPQQQQQLQLIEQQLALELAALSSQQQQQALYDNQIQSSEQGDYNSIGPAYQISNGNQDLISYGGNYELQQPASSSSSYGKENQQQHHNQQQQQQHQHHQHHQQQQQHKPYGLPTKSSNKEPSGMLKPLGNPKTISSPLIDFVANQLPKTTTIEKLNDKLPQTQTPTVFSFSSSKDPMDKLKGVNQKKRNVMRQAEQIAKMLIKSFNEKFGTNLGDQTDIPFLLSSLGPLGLAQNILFDPTLLVTLLNSAEKTYISDVLPGPAKMAMRPVLNIFRVPNKKRDKANLSNIISFLASGGQVPSSTPKHRQGTGVEKTTKNNKNSRRRRR